MTLADHGTKIHCTAYIDATAKAGALTDDVSATCKRQATHGFVSVSGNDTDVSIRLFLLSEVEHARRSY